MVRGDDCTKLRMHLRYWTVYLKRVKIVDFMFYRYIQ